MLNKRLAGFDFDLPPASARPFVAVPDVAIHLNGLLPQKLCDVRNGNLVLARLQGKEQIERGDERSEIISQTGGVVRGDFERRSNRCQTTADHDRTRPITTDLYSDQLPVLRGCRCVVIDGNLAGTHS
jgi:hypothetical protein